MRVERGICVRCASFKDRALGSCPACGHRPEGEERLLAWLFSRNFLDADELEEAATRLSAGEEVRPTPQLIRLARAALYPASAQAGLPPTRLGREQPLSGEQQVLLGFANVLLTPLFGFVLWWGFRQTRPVAARQTLRITAPVALVLGALWLSVFAIQRL